MKQQYVAGFMFSPDLVNVVLIEKKKPKWQKGKYNAVGGKIEPGETPDIAMCREFQEEACIKTSPEDWYSLCEIEGDDFKVFFFWCTSDQWEQTVSMTDEEVFTVPVWDLHLVKRNILDNLNWMIPLAVDKATCYSGLITV